jgi:hypothetical protein
MADKKPVVITAALIAAFAEHIGKNLRVVKSEKGREYVAFATQDGELLREVELNGVKGQVNCAWYALTDALVSRATKLELLKNQAASLTPEERAAIFGTPAAQAATGKPQGK